MSNPPVDIPTLANLLTAAGAGTAPLAAALEKLNEAADVLQAQIIAAERADPPQDTADLQNQLDLVNAWINALNAAVAATPAGGPPTADLLNAMQAVDQASAVSAGLNAMVVAVDAAVKAA